jgi:hypothetical protein
MPGKTGFLRSEMDHFAFPSVDVFVEKHNRYSNWEAQVALAGLASKQSDASMKRSVRWRRKLKRLSHHLPFRPLLRFLYVLVWQGGLLDGWEGYYFARLHGFYEFLSVTKTFELRKSRKPIPQQRIPKLLIVAPSLPSEGGEGRGEEGR